MELTTLLDDIQRGIETLQKQVDIIRAMNTGKMYRLDVQMTRKEAAAFIGRSVRQLDRLCDEHRIKRIYVGGSVRILKSSLLEYKGLVLHNEHEHAMSEMERLYHKYL